MPLESKKQLNNGKPLTPKAPLRSKSGPYLAPRLANPTRVTPSPETRKDTRTVATDGNVKASNGANIATPVKTFLATNVTPRSSSRKSRADSANSTPNSTPNGTPVNSRPNSMMVPVDESYGLGIRSGAEPRTIKANSTMSYGAGSSTIRDNPIMDFKELSTNGTDSPMFFHASDANSVVKKAPQPIAKEPSGFIYADGRREDPVSRPMSQVGSKAASQLGQQNKFFHSNGPPEAFPPRTASPANISPTTSPKLSSHAMHSHYLPSRQRSTSPLKEFEVPGQHSLTKARRASGASAMSVKSNTKSTISSMPQKHVPITSTSETRIHAKTQSMSSLDSQLRPHSTPVRPDPALFSIQSPQSPREVAASPSFFNIQTTQLGSPLTPTSPLVSPDRSMSAGGESKIDQLNSLAANARRERKVLDLEISNSSLLAINRTLEREMRKQKAELRRYRRLTSGGRLSFAPTERSVSGTTTISTLSLDSDLAFGSDEDNTLTDIESEDESEESDSDDSSIMLSPEAQAARDQRQRDRDEKRLQLDLSKHQQILIDSQKMNESLKRCLGWTEELILEGKKALEYQIRVSEVAMGGRVLHEDENPDFRDSEPRHGLLSPTRVDPLEDDQFTWTSGPSPSGTIVHRPGNNYASVMADEGKEFREYLDSLAEASA